MNNKQRKTLELIFKNPIQSNMIFKNPIQSNIRWDDIESLFRALGAEITEIKGSCVGIELNGFYKVYHKPHPQKETDRRTIKYVREFLVRVGVKQ